MSSKATSPFIPIGKRDQKNLSAPFYKRKLQKYIVTEEFFIAKMTRYGHVVIFCDVHQALMYKRNQKTWPVHINVVNVNVQILTQGFCMLNMKCGVQNLSPSNRGAHILSKYF